MERAEYERMHAVEDRMWWYRGLRTLGRSLLARALSRSAAAGPVLDAGCGTGGMLVALGPAVLGRPTEGLEFDEIAAGMAAAKSGRPVRQGSANAMPFGPESLAAYVSLDVLCHGGVEPDKALAEARRCLAPGGVALLNLPSYRWMLSAHDKRVHNVRRFTRSEVRALLARNGFRVLRASYWNTLLFPLMLIHRLANSSEGRTDAESDVRDYPPWLDAIFTAALRIERAAIGAGISLPFGGSLIVVAVRE